MAKINIVGISGSLKESSSNTKILKILQKLAPENIEIGILNIIGDLPHFNPDLDPNFPALNILRDSIAQADAVIFCTPEYAFGIPGVLKNALDWLVGSGELNEKPVIAISVSPLKGDKALASLLLTLTALGAKMNDQSSLAIGAVAKKLNSESELTDLKTEESLRKLLYQFN